MKEAKIILVEDDPDHAELIIDILETEDIDSEVVLIKDGQQALNYLQNTDIDEEHGLKSQVGLIVLDLNLPKVNGMEVLKFIKKNSAYCSTPVVILSTSSDETTIADAYKNGANDYITKPISYDEFVEKVKLLREQWLISNELLRKD
ncbi:MAG: response regulator [Candidatus Scalinduaceae bacterium]